MSDGPSTSKTLPDLLQRTREVRGDEVFYRFANGLEIKTEIFNKSDRLRILPLGTPQGSLMNHMLGFPERVAGKRVFEPFAGSGALGLMALKVGAARIDFLDINPRAAEFHRQNIAFSQLAADRVTSVTGDIATFKPDRKYDLLIANPPFVPTPRGIDGTITSNGGPEGNQFVEIMLDRFEEFLEPSGTALIYVMQLANDGQPLVCELIDRCLKERSVQITPAQAQPIPFDTYCDAYQKLFSKDGPAIERWRSELVGRHKGVLTVCHYVVDIGPRSDQRADWNIRNDFAEKFGETFLCPSENPAELAFGRVFENFVPRRNDGAGGI